MYCVQAELGIHGPVYTSWPVYAAGRGTGRTFQALANLIQNIHIHYSIILCTVPLLWPKWIKS